jgi:phosphotransferase system enzyme I (PtsI)
MQSISDIHSDDQNRILRGIPVSNGISIANVHVYDNNPHRVVSHQKIKPGQVRQEQRSLKEAIKHAIADLEKLRGKVYDTIDEAHAAIFDPQLLILQDKEFLERIMSRIADNLDNAAWALMHEIRIFADQFSEINDDFMADRSTDILDVGNRVSHYLVSSRENLSHPLHFLSNVNVVCSDLSPSDTAQMDHEHVSGFATELGGATSHTAILAKALEIPAIVGLGDFIHQLKQDTSVIINGYNGTVTLDPTPQEIRRAQAQHRRHLIREKDLAKLKNLPAETIDGYRVELSANIELEIEIPHVFEHGAEGVGLFRTEFHYLESNGIPSEESLFTVYRNVVRKIAPNPVIFRTIDLGGDKFFLDLHMGKELNPFLGLRAIRLCLARPMMFRTQLKAILRASSYGNARIMFPLISNISEIHAAHEVLDDARKELTREGHKFDKNIQVGIMIEIPSAAVCADQLAREVDFFSIGTNDLIQYTLAVDRGNEQVASLYDPFHPAILRLLRNIIQAANREGIWVGVCGEMASDPLCAILLVGLGVDELSMGPVAVPRIKRLIRQIRLADARKITGEIYSRLSSPNLQEYVENAYKIIQRKKRSKQAS